MSAFSEFTWRLILVFLPGIIAFVIIDNLTVHRETKIHHWFFYPLILGFISYAPWYLMITSVQAVYATKLPFVFFESITDIHTKVNFGEILIASLTAIILGFLLTWAITHRILFRISTFLHITDKFPEIDAWDNFISNFRPEWLTVRDLEKELIYQGKLFSASDANDRDGIVLQDVQVFNSKGKLQYWVPAVFIPRKMDCLLIEIPDPNPDTAAIIEDINDKSEEE